MHHYVVEWDSARSTSGNARGAGESIRPGTAWPPTHSLQWRAGSLASHPLFIVGPLISPVR